MGLPSASTTRTPTLDLDREGTAKASSRAVFNQARRWVSSRGGRGSSRGAEGRLVRPGSLGEGDGDDPAVSSEMADPTGGEAAPAGLAPPAPAPPPPATMF